MGVGLAAEHDRGAKAEDEGMGVGTADERDGGLKLKTIVWV